MCKSKFLFLLYAKVSSSQETPRASQKELSPPRGQSTPLSSQKSPPNKTTASHGDMKSVASLSSSSSSASSTSFQSPVLSTSQPTASLKSTSQKISGSSSTAVSSWSAETKRPTKALHSTPSGRG